MVRVVPFHYTGKVWCLRVPTGAFVAVRNGVAFPTGNSGFPKSLDVSKALDKAAGAEREKVLVPTKPGNTRGERGVSYAGESFSGFRDIGEAVTDAARQWQGWGTALKPSLEPITVARKPLIGTVVANVLAHGTGALNIDGCRVGTETVGWGGASGGSDDPTQSKGRNYRLGEGKARPVEGRWPANLILSDDPEVLAAFPQAKGQQGAITGSEPSSKTANTFGEFAGRASSAPRGDTGSAARFFKQVSPEADDFEPARFMYCAKASKRDRSSGMGFEYTLNNDVSAEVMEKIQAQLNQMV